MSKFMMGLLVGLMLGSGVAAIAAGVFGSGELTGWSVMMDGEEVCTDPDTDVASKEILC